MTIDTKKLRELANAATPGPWFVNEDANYGNIWVDSSVTKEGVALCDGGDWIGPCAANAAFIAAANPQTVLELLDEIERLRKDRTNV